MNESTRQSGSSVATAGNQQTSLEKINGSELTALSRVSYDYETQEDGGLHLRDYWRVLRKHIFLIAGLTLLIPTIVAIFLIRKPDVFEAQARIQVDLENPNSLLGGMSKNSSVILSSETNDPAY